MRPATIEAARAVLVGGQDQAEVGRQYGLTRQRIHQIVARVEAAAAGVPKSWTKVECWLPPEVAAEVQCLAERIASDPSDADVVAHALNQLSNEREISMKMQLDVPAEFFDLAERYGLDVEDILRGFIADACRLDSPVDSPRADGYCSNGSDEEMLAEDYLERAYGQD
ncbi:TrfB-related DNA-binding protein [Thiocystis violacea]|uniref:TrfB-related DNA-binding protein n=1 Tax=Thiocystis violacea TaxID=13725 RepID=UPI001F5BF0F9|nr:TrfB-related DNA-binding protein [Thiocystis violacea]